MPAATPAKQYAQALLNIAQESNSADQQREECTKLQDLLTASNDLRLFLTSPRIPSDQRRAILAEIFQAKTSELFYRFLFFLESKNRLGILDEICREYELLYLSSIQSVNAEITSVVPFSSDQLNNLTEQLTKRHHNSVVPQTSIDKNLLGGFKIKINDQVYDYSVRSKLERFREQIIHST